MKKSTKILVVLLIILFLMLIGGGVYFFFFKQKPVEEAPTNEVIITNTIDEYEYNLEDRDTELFKNKFEELKELLNQEEFSKEDYITLVSELFVTDLFTISNKISRYDVGGLEYVYSGAVDSFRSVAENSIYKTVENNIDGSRSQNLPEVSSISVTDISTISYEMPDESSVEGYRVAVNWEYVTDYGYDDSAVLVLIPDENKMGVVFYKTK